MKARGCESGRRARLLTALAVLLDDPKQQERFWSKVEKLPDDGCWNWTSSLNIQGYTQFWIAPLRGCIPAHRLAWVLAGNEIPDGLCHHCDNRACVNPDHMFLGTQGDNLRDMVTKGRHPETVLKHRSAA